MRADHVFRVIDSHAGGAPSRLVLSGLPAVSGATLMDRMAAFERDHDWIRRALVLEPRGGNNTSAVILTPPTRPDADVAVFFAEAHGYLPMCGSDTIATVTALLETGQLPITGPQTLVRVETPAGLIEATAQVDAGKVRSVTFVGAPAFCLLPQVPVDVPGVGEIAVDVAYGGNFYAIVDAAAVGLSLPSASAPAVDAALRLIEAVNARYDVRHPQVPEIRRVTHAQFFGPTVDGVTPMLVVMETGTVDRSPCGTGTTAKVATLFARGELEVGEPFVHRSFTGAEFTGRVVQVLDDAAVRVAITGTSYVIADASIYVDREDPLAHGFQLR